MSGDTVQYNISAHARSVNGVEYETSTDDYLDYDQTDFLFNFARYLLIYIQPVLCMFGLIGNTISFVIFVSPSMRKISSNIYLAALSGSSYGFNLVSLLQWMEVVQVHLMRVQGLCQCIVYLGYVFGFLSVWLIVCITVENYIVTFHLSKASVYCSVVRAKIVVGLLTGSAILMYSGHLWTSGVVDLGPGVILCTEIDRFAFINRLYFFWDTITTIILPGFITTGLIIAILSRNLCIHFRSVDITIRRLSKKQRSLIRITRVLLAISLTYVILSAPSHVNRLRHTIIAEVYGRQHVTLEDRSLVQVFLIIYYCSFCLNFIYYLAWSINFRKEFKRLFTFKKCTRKRDLEMYHINGGHYNGNVIEKSANHTKITIL